MRQPPPKSSLEFQAPHAVRRIEGPVRVRATRRGFYDNHVKEPGDVFTIRAQDKLGSWMELVADETVEQPATGEQPAKVEQLEPPANAGQTSPSTLDPAKPAKEEKPAKPPKEPKPAPVTKSDNDVL